VAAITAPPCAQHAAPQADCGDCRGQAARALDIIDKLGALSGAAEAGLTAVADGTQFLAGLTALLGGRLADDTGDIAAELAGAGRALRHVRRIVTALASGGTIGSCPPAGRPAAAGPGQPIRYVHPAGEPAALTV
jgi:hypothetical protein